MYESISCAWIVIIVLIILFIIAIWWFFSSNSNSTNYIGTRTTVPVETTIILSGKNEVPPTPTAESGSARIVLNGNSLTYVITVNPGKLTSSITSAHFHKGALGVNGGIVFNIIENSPAILCPNGTISYSGTWNNLTPENLMDLKNGNIYINVHTTNYPNGEIRGQVTL